MRDNIKKRLATVYTRIAQDKIAFLEQIRKTPIVQIAAEKSGTARSTIYRWRKEDPKFAKAMDEALREGRLLVNDMAESQILAAIRDRNMSAITFWLKHHHPSYATKVEINANINENHELTPEQKILIREALRLATLPKLGGDASPEEAGAKPGEYGFPDVR